MAAGLQQWQETGEGVARGRDSETEAKGGQRLDTKVMVCISDVIFAKNLLKNNHSTLLLETSVTSRGYSANNELLIKKAVEAHSSDLSSCVGCDSSALLPCRPRWASLLQMQSARTLCQRLPFVTEAEPILTCPL